MKPLLLILTVASCFSSFSQSDSIPVLRFEKIKNGKTLTIECPQPISNQNVYETSQKIHLFGGKNDSLWFGTINKFIDSIIDKGTNTHRSFVIASLDTFPFKEFQFMSFPVKSIKEVSYRRKAYIPLAAAAFSVLIMGEINSSSTIGEKVLLSTPMLVSIGFWLHFRKVKITPEKWKMVD